MKIEWGDEALGVTTGRIIGTGIEVDRRRLGIEVDRRRFGWGCPLVYAIYLVNDIDRTVENLGSIEVEATLSDEEIIERATVLAVTHALSE
jgi:hypothetical protein